MNELQLKLSFHQLIDEFEDIEVLEHFYQIAYAYQSKNKAKDTSLLMPTTLNLSANLEKVLAEDREVLTLLAQ